MKTHRNSASSAHKLARISGFARAMRARPTTSESALWRELSASKLGVSFRRQALVLEAIVDFLAPVQKLIIEVDGPYHAEPSRRRADARRDKRLGRAGYRVLRLPAELVLADLPEAVRRIRAALEAMV